MPVHPARLVVVLALATASTSLAPSRVHAGGYELPGHGSRALGRAGAFAARADDGLALLYNPAALAHLPGTSIGLDVHLGFLDACYARRSAPSNTYLDGLGTSASASRFDADPSDPGAWAVDARYPEVCNGGPPGPSPQLTFVQRASESFGWGAGVLAPFAVGGHSLWGEQDGTTSGGRLPTPSRYVLVEQNLLLLHPSVAAAYRPIPRLSIGATVRWGIGHFRYRNLTRATGGESPAGDVLSDLSVTDPFVPSFVTSIHAIPFDALDVVARFQWSDRVLASGRADLVYAHFGAATPGGSVTGPLRATTRFEDVALEAPQPWSVGLAVRFAQRFAPRPRDPRAVRRLSGRVEDAMSNERFDVELDVQYERNSIVDDLVIRFPDAPERRALAVPEWDGTMVVPNTLPVPPRIAIPHRWKDQLSVRLGGDFNAIPGMAAVRLGVSYETGGVRPAYANLDFWPVERIGVHAGLTARLGNLDVSLAYAHFFQQTLEVAPEEARLPQISADEMGAIVNAGSYTSNADVLSLAVRYHL
ncbi:MAG: outer membrane protein transport protein [Myxococcota bacterium]|nr:outer membrane protein transport protein [Myxococcota bacterium]MDW8363363.1 hypothetical protein [Myxococcales bacterium]